MEHCYKDLPHHDVRPRPLICLRGGRGFRGVRVVEPSLYLELLVSFNRPAPDAQRASIDHNASRPGTLRGAGLPRIVCLTEELLLVGVEVVDATFLLRSIGAFLVAESTGHTGAGEFLETLLSKILKTVANTKDKVGKIVLDGTLVHDGSGDTLGDANLLLSGEVADVRSLGHCVDGSHTTILLDTNTVNELVGSRSFLSTGKHRTHHNHGGAKGESFGDVSGVGDTSISPDRDAKLVSKGGDVVDCSGLRTADSTNFLCGANRSNTHTNTEAIASGGNEVGGLAARDDVTANDIKLGEVALDPLDHLQLVHGVTLRGVNNDEVNPGFNEGSHTLLVVRAGSDGSTNEELLISVLGGVREVAVLEKVLARHQSNKVALLVGDEKFGGLRVYEDLVKLLELLVVFFEGGDELVGWSHNLLDRRVAIFDKVDVSGRDKAEELGSELPVLRDGNAAKPVLGLDKIDIRDLGSWSEALRVGDKTILEALDEHNLAGLFLDGVVVVDDTDTTLKSHGNSHFVFGDGVHGGGDQGDVKLDVAGEHGGKVYVIDAKVDGAREQDNVVVSVSAVALDKHLIAGHSVTKRLKLSLDLILLLGRENLHGGLLAA